MGLIRKAIARKGITPQPFIPQDLPSNGAARRRTSATRARLAEDAARLDALAARAGWHLVGGTTLFRTYDTGDATAAQAQLARGRIWSRVFPYSTGWIRLGLPGSAADWAQLEAALATG